MCGNVNREIENRLAALGVRPGDVAERFVLGSGKGGQKIQKTASCVWLRHGPTGTEVRCQRERSQALNRERAWEELCGKLEALRRAGEDGARDARERLLRRTRQKSPGQKARMIESKKHRAGIKARRSRPAAD